jgi:hypothetical protein
LLVFDYQDQGIKKRLEKKPLAVQPVPIALPLSLLKQAFRPLSCPLPQILSFREGFVFIMKSATGKSWFSINPILWHKNFVSSQFFFLS